MRYTNATPLWPGEYNQRGALYVPADVEPPACWDLDDGETQLGFTIAERRCFVLGLVIGMWPGAILMVAIELLMRVM